MKMFCVRFLSRILSLFIIASVFLSCQPGEKKVQLDQDLLKKLKAGKVLLPNGWSLTPPLNSLPLDELPLNLQVSSSGRLAAVTNNGYGKQSVMLFDIEREKLLDRVEVPKAWFGLRFSKDEQTLYVSGGNDNLIRIYSI